MLQPTLNEDLENLLKDPNFKLDEWLRRKKKALSDALQEEYERNRSRSTRISRIEPNDDRKVAKN